MTDERGGRYFREARFFLAGDRAVAQSHILEARSLLGYLRDQHSMGGPPILVKYATLSDGTQIKAVMMNGQYQAEIVSPRLPLVQPPGGVDVVFIFGVLGAAAEVIYRPISDEFVVIEPLIYEYLLPNGDIATIAYTEHTNYWYGTNQDASTGVAATVPGPWLSAVWSVAPEYNKFTYAGLQPAVLGSAVWGPYVASAVRSGTTYRLTVRDPTSGAALPTPLGDPYATLSSEDWRLATFSPVGDKAVVIKKSTPATDISPTLLGSYVLAQLSQTTDPARPYAVSYAEVNPALVYESQAYHSGSVAHTMLRDTRSNQCYPKGYEYVSTRLASVVPGINRQETILSVGFDEAGNPLVLTRLNEELIVGGFVGDAHESDDSQHIGVATWSLPDSQTLMTGQTKYVRDFSHTTEAVQYVETRRITYKVNGVVVYVSENVLTGDTVASGGGFHQEFQLLAQVVDGCGATAEYPYSGPSIAPPGWPYVMDTWSYPPAGTESTTWTDVGDTSELLWSDLRAHLFVFRIGGLRGHGDLTRKIILVTRNGEHELPVNNAGLTDQSSYRGAFGAAHAGKALIHIRGTDGYTNSMNMGVFLVTVGTEEVGDVIEDVTGRVPNGWTPNGITLCADYGLKAA